MKALEESLYIYHLENHSNPPQEAVPWLGSLKYLNQTRQTNNDNVFCIQVFVQVDLEVRQDKTSEERQFLYALYHSY